MSDWSGFTVHTLSAGSSFDRIRQSGSTQFQTSGRSTSSRDIPEFPISHPGTDRGYQHFLHAPCTANDPVSGE